VARGAIELSTRGFSILILILILIFILIARLAGSATSF
jgi:hypothetical protein